jgi:hypothetical protein
MDWSMFSYMKRIFSSKSPLVPSERCFVDVFTGAGIFADYVPIPKHGFAEKSDMRIRIYRNSESGRVDRTTLVVVKERDEQVA